MKNREKDFFMLGQDAFANMSAQIIDPEGPEIDKSVTSINPDYKTACIPLRFYEQFVFGVLAQFSYMADKFCEEPEDFQRAMEGMAHKLKFLKDVDR